MKCFFIIELFFLLISIESFSQYVIKRENADNVKLVVIDTINNLPVLNIFSMDQNEMEADFVPVLKLPKKMANCYFKLYCNGDTNNIRLFGEIKDDKLTGNFIMYHANNIISEISNYKDDERIGCTFLFHPDGKLKAIFYNGEDSYKSEFWTKDGEKMSIDNYRAIYGY